MKWLWTKKQTDQTTSEGAKKDHPDSQTNNQVQPTNGEVLPPDFEESLKLPNPHDWHPGRHLFVFLDGTWNEERTPIGEATPTNVLRMFQEINRQSQSGGNQNVIARYYRGVGSRQDNNAADRMWFGFNGKDEQRIRAAAFAGLYRDYQSENDSIYIIGFSRGAASARLLARDLCIEGLPSALTVKTCHFANLLTGQIEARVEEVKRGDEIKIKPKVKFLGCWDTVDAFVLPSRFPSQNWKDKFVRILKYPLPRLLGKERFSADEKSIPKKVEKAVHCVAIDETRNAFLPTLMPRDANVEEVWFAGVHSDVGGGYDDNSLADEAYDFMKRRVESASGGAITIGASHSASPSKIIKETSSSSGTSRSASPQPISAKPESYCFHFHGLNTGVQRAKDLLGFGTSLRKIRILAGESQGVHPKIHSSIFKVMKSSNVHAANKKDKRTWRVNYDPYNVRELRESFDIVDT